MNLINLFEDNVTTIGIIFGRFNPPHKGHRAAWEMASANDFWFIGTNQSTIGPKDPLPFDVKVQAMTTIWPEAEGHIVEETSWLTLATRVHNQYNQDGDAILLCYTDEEWVGKLINQYNGVEGKHGGYNFKQITMVPTPRLSSATALRNAVLLGDKNAFSDAAGVPADTPIDGVEFFDLVAEYLLPYAEAGKAKVSEGVFGNYFSKMKDKNKYPLAKEFYRRTMDDPKYSSKSPEFVAAKVAAMFGFSSPRDFVKYVNDSLTEDELSEINMSPGALKSFLSSGSASGIRFGFEAELLIPGLEPSEEDDLEPNIEDYDEEVNANSMRDLQNDLENFFSETTTSTEIQRAIERVNSDIIDFIEIDFQQYLESNQGREELRSLVSDAIGSDDEDEIDQEIENETRDYENVVDDMRDDFYGTWDNLSDALDDLGLAYMSGWYNKFYFPWPHYRGGEGGDVSFDEFAERLADDLDIKIRTGSSYKSVKRDDVSWIMEPDPSIEGDYAGAEIISPPMDINTGLEKMREFFNWMQDYGAETNKSTGLHVGVSLPEDQMKNVDWLKAIVLLGDKYVLEQFGRLGNTYTGSALNKIEYSIRSNRNDVFPLLAQMKTDLGAASKTLMDRYSSRDKYTSVNIKSSTTPTGGVKYNYVEFRSMGGDYIDRLNDIENMVLRFVAVLSIAADPNEAKDEYAKKLYKLIDRMIGNTEYDDTIRIFSMLASNQMPRAAAKSYIRQIQQKRQEKKKQSAADYDPDSDLPLWDLVDYEGDVIHQVRAANRQEASRIGLDWGRRNNKVIAGINLNYDNYYTNITPGMVGEAIEPDEPGYQHDLLTMPANTLVIDTPGELDWYKIGQHFPTLSQQDPHEYGQSESDMMITFANEREKNLFIKLASKIGLKVKDISSSPEQPEIHSEAWSKDYKKSIDCNNPKGFSQKAHCAGRKKKSVKEARSFAPQTTPLQDLVIEYLNFTSIGIMTIVKDGAKSPDAAQELKKVFATLTQSFKKLQPISNDKQKLENNRNAILKYIHDMMNYAIAHLKANMIPQEFDAKKKQINILLTKYNNLVKNESVNETRCKKVTKEDIQRLEEKIKKVKGKWALVSKTKPERVLQYYHGKDHPSKDWEEKVERRVQYFKHKGK